MNYSKPQTASTEDLPGVVRKASAPPGTLLDRSEFVLLRKSEKLSAVVERNAMAQGTPARAQLSSRFKVPRIHRTPCTRF